MIFHRFGFDSLFFFQIPKLKNRLFTPPSHEVNWLLKVYSPFPPHTDHYPSPTALLPKVPSPFLSLWQACLCLASLFFRQRAKNLVMEGREGAPSWLWGSAPQDYPPPACTPYLHLLLSLIFHIRLACLANTSSWPCLGSRQGMRVLAEGLGCYSHTPLSRYYSYFSFPKPIFSHLPPLLRTSSSGFFKSTFSELARSINHFESSYFEQGFVSSSDCSPDWE